MLRCAFALLFMLSLGAQAQTQVRAAHVYRCGPDGRDLRDSPCPGQAAASSAVAFDQPSAADTLAARQRHLADARRAAELEKSNREAEAKARRENARGIGLNAPPAPASAASSAKPARNHPPKAAKQHHGKASAPTSGR